MWIDALRATAIDGFTYQGAPIPDLHYDTSGLVVHWEVLGPLTKFYPEVEMRPFDPDLAIRDGDRTIRWRSFEADPRGAVLTGRVTDHEGPRRVAYFHATVTSDRVQDAPLGLSSVDNLALWLNDQFEGFVSRDGTAWWDFRTNEDHRVDSGTLRLVKGENHLLIRVVGGTYATGGFFLSLAPDDRGGSF